MEEKIVDGQCRPEIGAGDVEVECDGTSGVFFSEVEDDGYDFVGGVFVNVFSNHHDAVTVHSGVNVDELCIVGSRWL